MSVERYKPEVAYHADDAGYPSGEMYKVYDGDWVKFSDYEAANARAEAAEADADHQHKLRVKENESFAKIYLENQNLKAQIEQLQEQLRWRKWPEEKPENLVGQYLVWYEDIGERDVALWKGHKFKGQDPDYWLPIPPTAVPEQQPEVAEE